MAAKKTLTMKDLIAKKADPQEPMLSVPINIRAKIRADITEVARAKLQGSPIPGSRQISEFIKDTYDYRVAHSTVQSWLTRIIKELSSGKTKNK